MRRCAHSRAMPGSSEASGQRQLVLETLRARRALARQHCGDVARALVAARDQHLLADEDAAGADGRDRAHRGLLRPLGQLERDRGGEQHRRRDALAELAHLGVDALVRRDVVAGAGEARGQRVEQHCVDVVADAEGEELHVGRRTRLRGVDDAVAVLDADSRQTVREEHDRRGAVAGQEVHRLAERLGDVGAAPVRDILDPRLGVCDGGRRAQLVGERGGGVGEADDAEAVVSTEVVEDAHGRRAGLLDLLAVHGAAAVDHDHDVARDALASLERGREQQREVAVLIALLVREQARGYEAVAAGEVQAEVAGRRPVGRRLPRRVELARPVPIDGGHVAGRDGGPHLPRHVDSRSDRGRSRSRRHARPRRLDHHLVGLGREGRRDGVAHLARLARRDGERANLVEVATQRAQQRGVDQATDDLLVDARRVVGVEQLALEGLLAARQREPGHDAVRGQRDDHAAFGEATPAGVLEGECPARHVERVADRHVGLGVRQACVARANPPAVGAWHDRGPLRLRRRRHRRHNDGYEQGEQGRDGDLSSAHEGLVPAQRRAPDGTRATPAIVPRGERSGREATRSAGTGR